MSKGMTLLACVCALAGLITQGQHWLLAGIIFALAGMTSTMEERS